MGDHATRDHLEPLDEGGGRRATVGLHDRDDDILAFLPETGALLEHGEGLANPGGGPEEHAEPPPLHCAQPFNFDSAMFNWRTFTVGSPM